MKRKIVRVSILASLALLPVGCGGEKSREGSEVKRPVVIGLETAIVSPVEIDDYYETSATVKAKTESLVAARMMGTVTDIAVREGDRVKAGQLLLALDDRDVMQKINAAQAALGEAESALASAGKEKELAKTTFERFSRLYEGKALTRQELDEAQTRKNVAEFEYERYREMVKRSRASLNEALVYQDFTRVSSPVDGVVSKKMIELGTMAMPGVPLFTIEDTSSFRLETGVDESLVDQVKKGITVDVTIPATRMSLKGVVSDVVPAVDPRTRNFLVKIEVKGEGLQSGMYVNVRLPVAKRSAILLPRDIIIEKGQLTGVYTIGSDNLITYRLVRLGKKYGDKREILTGLNPGEKVLTAGLERAVDGALLQEGHAQ